MDTESETSSDPAGEPVRCRVTIDGAPRWARRGGDVAADGTGVVDGQRAYQLSRPPPGTISDRVLEVRFLEPGVQACTCTFG